MSIGPRRNVAWKQFNGPIAPAMVVIILVAVAGGMLSGCARWNGDFAEPAPAAAVAAGGLPEAKIPAAASIVDVAFVPMQAIATTGEAAAPWQRMDEAVIPPGTRRWLAA